MTMQLSKPITNTSSMLINFYEAQILPSSCAKLMLAATKDKNLEQLIGSCAIDARNLHNGFNEEYGNYADAVIARLIAHA